MGKKIDITNPSKYARLKILGESEKIHRSGKRKVRYVKVLCDCGNVNTTRLDHLVTGRTKSCGCHKLEVLRLKGKNLKHGDCGTSLHHRWNGIISRCYNKNNVSYYRYGGRGVDMCDEWRNDYLKFKEWALKNNYKENLQIDRIDNNGNYEPNNCRWVTGIVNANNKSNNLFITYDGQRKTLSNWAKILGINKSTLQTRITRKKWSVKRAFEQPIETHSARNKT
jgi:hypothetical protein